jgi:hypothetical protein
VVSEVFSPTEYPNLQFALDHWLGKLPGSGWRLVGIASRTTHSGA